MTKISVIVPIYNVENYINECIDSILNQEYSNIEIILVDDGSTDSSGEICDYFSKQDDRVKVIHSKNKGLSAARNIGVKNCTGEYIMFIDGDDFISTDCIKDIARLINNNISIDIICGKIIKYYDNGNEVYENFNFDEKKIINKKGTEVLTYFFEEIKETTMWSACRSIYKRDFFMNNKILFKEGITSEDLDIVPIIYMKANNIVSYNKPFYYYRQLRPNSIINTVNVKRFEDIINIINKYLLILNKHKYEERFKQSFITQLANVYASYVVIIGDANTNDRSHIEKMMRQLSWILKNTSDARGRFVYFGNATIGMTLTYKIYSIVKKLCKSNSIIKSVNYKSDLKG